MGIKIYILFIVHIILFLSLLFYGIKLLIGEKKIYFLRNERLFGTKTIGIIFIVISILFIYPITTDIVFKKIGYEMIIVEDVTTTNDRATYYQKVNSFDKQHYHAWFNPFPFVKGHVYKIQYLKNSKIIISATIYE